MTEERQVFSQLPGIKRKGSIMFGSDYVRLVGYIGDGYAVCRKCAEKDTSTNFQSEDFSPVLGYELDSLSDDDNI